MLEIRDVSFTFDGQNLLKDINYSFRNGKAYVITGEDNSGKGMLMKILGGIIKPTAGNVFISGQSIYTSSQRNNLKAKIGFVFQDGVFLSNLSIYENLFLPVSYFHPDYNQEEYMLRIIEMFKEFQIRIETLDKRPSDVSYSVKKLINLIRAVLIDPELYLINKPLFNLDFGDCEKVTHFIERIKQSGKLIIMTTNNKSIIKQLGDVVILLVQGEIVTVASTNEFFHSSNPHINSYVNSHLG